MTTLVIVTVLLGALALVLRKRTGAPGRLNTIRVPARASLHRGATIAVVEIDGRRLLVGAGAQGVSLITELATSPTATETTATETTATEIGAVGSDSSAVLHEVPVARAITSVDSPASLLDHLRRATTRTADPVARTAKLPLRKGVAR